MDAVHVAAVPRRPYRVRQAAMPFGEESVRADPATTAVMLVT